MKSASLFGRNIGVSAVAFLLAIGVIFNLIVWFEPVDLSPLEGEAQMRDQSTPPTRIAADGSEIVDLVDTLERPLFSPTRKMFHPPETPPPAEDVVAEPVAMIELTPPSLRLYGTRELSGVRAGLVATAPSNKEEWVSQGSVIAGWTVSEITQDKLTLSHGAQVRTYSLFEQNMEP